VRMLVVVRVGVHARYYSTRSAGRCAAVYAVRRNARSTCFTMTEGASPELFAGSWRR